MSLIDRLAGVDGAKIGCHTFYAALGELAAGEITKAQIETFFNLLSDDGNGVDETAELQVIIDGYNGAANNRKLEYVEFIHKLFLLAEEQAPGYSTRGEINARIARF